MERIILVSWSGCRERAFLLNLLFWLIKELRLCVSCCQTCTGPVWCAVPRPALPLHTMAFVKTMFALLQRQDKWLVCSQTALSPADTTSCGDTALTTSGRQTAVCWGQRMLWRPAWKASPWATQPYATSRGPGLQQVLPLQKRLFGLSPWLGHITFPVFSLKKLSLQWSVLQQPQPPEERLFPISLQRRAHKQLCLLEPPQSLQRAYTQNHSDYHSIEPGSQFRYTGSTAIFKRIRVCKWIWSHLEMSPLQICGGVGPQLHQTHKDP